MRFTEEQISAVVSELKKRSKKIKEMQPETMGEEWVFKGYIDAYENLCKEIEEHGGLDLWH